MSKLKIQIEKTVLQMNTFPGWIEEDKWLKTFSKKVEGISFVYLTFFLKPKSLKKQSTGDYVKFIKGGEDSTTIGISKNNLISGEFSSIIDKKALTASLSIEGKFEIDVSSLENNEIKDLKESNFLYAQLFTFTDKKEEMTQAQGCFTDSWDSYKEISFSILQ